MLTHYPSLRAFGSYIKRFQKAFWATATVFALADITITLVPWLVGKLTISLTAHQKDGAILWTAMLILSQVAHSALWRSAEVMYLRLLMKPSFDFDGAVFQAVMEHSYGFFVNNFTGKISSYANSLGRDFRELFNNFHYEYVNLFVAVPIIAATMFTVNIYTGIIFVVSLVLMFITGRKLAVIAGNAERDSANERSNVEGYVVDAVANFVSVKAFGSELREARRLHQKRQILVASSQYAYWKSMWFWGAMGFFVRVVIWPSTFILNVYLYMNGQISLAQVTTFLTAIVLFSNFIWEVVWNLSQVNIKLAGIEEAYRYLFGTMNIFKETSAKIEQLREADFQKSLELRHLTFAYPDKPDITVLENISLTIKRGEKIGLVGHSGGGKSTLLKLLLGYYQVESGQLMIDSKQVDNRALTDLVAYVPQDTAIFHRSIRENIAYGRPDASEAEIVQAAKHAQADEFIRQLPDGYDTLVGERGVKLSGGQRQRIAIARALIKRAPILMLDEATSALDSESERLIQKALRDLLENHTAIVIAHRLSTIQKMDRIFVIDNGKVIESGTHTQLLKHGGTYAKLWEHQSGGFIED